MACEQSTYQEDGWIVTKKKFIVLRKDLDQYGGVGADSGWIGNPHIKQYRTVVVGAVTSEEQCCEENR